MHRPRLSPALFALICMAFVLPFATVSCDGAETSFTGLQLVTWTVPQGGPVSESDCSLLRPCSDDEPRATRCVSRHRVTRLRDPGVRRLRCLACPDVARAPCP